MCRGINPTTYRADNKPSSVTLGSASGDRSQTHTRSEVSSTMKIRRYQARRIIVTFVALSVFFVATFVRAWGFSTLALLCSLFTIGVGAIAALIFVPLGLWLHDFLWEEKTPTDSKPRV